MNEKTRGIIIAVVVLAALGGTLGVLHLTGMDSSGSGDSSGDSSAAKSSVTSSVDESVKLIDTEAQDIKKITVTNEYGGFTYTGESDSGKESYGITELDGIALDANKLTDIGEDTAKLTAYKSVEENASDLSKYGLTKPAAEFAVTFADGSERTFMIGDVAHKNRYRYVSEKNEGDVYMVLESTIQYFLGKAEDLADPSLFPAQSEDDVVFGKLTLSRKDLNYDMVFEQDNGDNERSNENMPSAQVMTEPIFSYLNGSTSSEVIYSLYGLTAISAEVIYPDEAALKEYGLDDPRAVVTFVGEDYDWTLNIGGEFHEENDDGEEQTAASAYYCTVKGVDNKDAIWKIDASALPWVELVPGDVITTLMTYNNIWQVGEIDISGEVDTTYTITQKDEEVTGAEQDGEKLDVEEFKGLYQYLLTCPTSEIWFEEPENEPYLTIDIKRTDGGGDKLEFCKDTERRVIVKLNGRTSYKIKTSWVNTLLKNIDALKSGGTVQQNY